MIFNKLRLRFFLIIIAVSFSIFFSIYYLLSKDRRDHLFIYFSTRCLDYYQKDFSKKLNDRIVDYSAAARLKGIDVCKDEKELRKRISDGRLVKVTSGNKYLIERMTFSVPAITKESKMLLDEIGRRFRDKTSEKGLKEARFIVTSMTRKSESMRSLRRNNQNASENSPHLHGNAFDISYKRFIVRKWVVTNCDKKFLKDALGEVIWELREEGKCWATYEKGQSCYHIVLR
jgi:uncharacterized protein YcbK (DUF882 family)